MCLTGHGLNEALESCLYELHKSGATNLIHIQMNSIKSTTTNPECHHFKEIVSAASNMMEKNQRKVIRTFVKPTSHLLGLQNTRLSDGRIFKKCYG